LVILAKKLEHVELEKFCAMLPSKVEGTVGRVGGVLGIIGAGWSLIGVCDEELAGGAEVVVDNVDWEAKSDSDACTWGSGLRS